MLDIMRLTPEQMERYIHMQSVVERQEAHAEKVRALREYYEGEHPTLLTDRQREYLGALVETHQFTFAHNLIRTVVDTLSERLSVTGFAVNGVEMEDEEGADTARLIWQWWKSSRADLLEQDLYVDALRDGLAYVMVDYDAVKQRPRIVVHPVDDGRSGVMLHRDPEDSSRVLFATRYFWTFDPLNPGNTGIERKTVYLPGEIRKYQRRTQLGGWVPLLDDGDEAWPLPWVDSAGTPLGVAVIEFANPGGAEAESIIGLQNALNKTWLDLIAAADAAGFPILAIEYADGNALGPMASDDDLQGTDEFRIAPGRLLEVSGATVRRIEAANLTPLMDVIWALTAAMAGVSRTPQYYLRPVGGADVPSGESLKQMESGLVARAVKRQRVWGQAWEDVMGLSLRIAEAYGTGMGIEADASITVQWADANTRNELSQAQMAQIHKALNVPDEQVWQTLGYTPEQIAEFRSSASADKAAQVAGIAAALRTQQTGSNPNERTGNTLQSGGRNVDRGSAQRSDTAAGGGLDTNGAGT
jgi:hypothetical protein